MVLSYLFFLKSNLSVSISAAHAGFQPIIWPLFLAFLVHTDRMFQLAWTTAASCPLVFAFLSPAATVTEGRVSLAVGRIKQYLPRTAEARTDKHSSLFMSYAHNFSKRAPLATSTVGVVTLGQTPLSSLTEVMGNGDEGKRWEKGIKSVRGGWIKGP